MLDVQKIRSKESGEKSQDIRRERGMLLCQQNLIQKPASTKVKQFYKKIKRTEFKSHVKPRGMKHQNYEVRLDSQEVRKISKKYYEATLNTNVQSVLTKKRERETKMALEENIECPIE